MTLTVTATEFQTRAGRYFDQAAKQPVFITKHQQPTRVLLDIEEYERLKRLDTRQAFYAHELPEALKAELEKGYQGEDTPELEHLMK